MTSRPARSRRRRGGASPATPAAAPAAATATATAAPSPTGATSFTALGVPASLADVLARDGITTPFPIQAATLPDALAGRDVLGRGRTGSGKTVAFALPTINALTGQRARPGSPLGLILAPTRELANQIAATLKPLADASGVRITTIYGGVKQGPQVSALRSGVELVIGCPGRIEDLVRQQHLSLGQVRVTVLDECDHLADLGFLPVVRRLLDTTPAGGQRLLFSATLDGAIDKLVRTYLSNPVTHSVDAVAAAPVPMTHHLLRVEQADKRQVVTQLATGPGRRILFTRTKHGAKKLARQLTASGVPAVDLHGNLAQNARTRNLAAFSSGQVRVLVATDIAARGIHVDDVELVVHVDPPAEHKAYLHRSGRTARAGAAGAVVTVVLPEQAGEVAALTRKAKITATTATARPGDAHVNKLAAA
ncbi:DEAD/DEAH box helicase [Ornithinicoccus halotolerans]|uniref:DEAD/DEAH box helicase n=1 Tax=Ornithinicoccus halotolerans TaxID=1748220 RepID=UPI001294AFF1